MNAFINGIKWQKCYDPLKTISRRYCNRLHKNPYSSQIKTEIKENTTATYWGHLYKQQDNENLPKHYYLLVDYSQQISDKNIGGTLAGTPPVFPCYLHHFLFFQVFHQRAHTLDDRADLAHHQLPGLPSKRLYVGRPCWFCTSPSCTSSVAGSSIREVIRRTTVLIFHIINVHIA